MQAREKDNRRDWFIILAIILIGLLCILLAGSWAVRLTPSWSLDSNMESKIDPNSQFLTERPNGFIAPVNSSILTQPVWYEVFLTPGASFKTGTPPPTRVNTQPPPPPTQTKAPTLVPTLTITPWIVIKPTNTTGGNPPTPTRTSIPTTPSADLQITLDNNSATYVIGGTQTYTIVVYNPVGPSAVTGATVVDNFPAILSGVTWTCTATGGATCTPNGTGNINDTINLPVGATVTYAVTANVSPAAIGDLVNTALVTVPVGYLDPDTRNNSATHTDVYMLSADLQINKDDNSLTYTPNLTTVYTIIVYNDGPDAVTGAVVTDNKPTLITNWTWDCLAQNGGATGCDPLPNSAANFTDMVNLPVGGSVTYTVTANISAYAAGTLTNTALVNAPAGILDTQPGNNSATDSDTPVPGTEPNVGGPNGNDLNPGPNGSITLLLSQSITAGGTGSPDFVYYEIRSNPVMVDLDWVQIEVSADGVTWYTVFVWGDGIPDTNSNVDINVIGGAENDNRQISTSDLYNQTGVTIDIDAIPGIVAGTAYPWIRISGIGGVDGPNIDAIQPYYP